MIDVGAGFVKAITKILELRIGAFRRNEVFRN
jgi:hypothetical protein